MALNNKCIVDGIFCDLRKAFDCVSHDILLSKMEFYGIKGIAQKLMRSYLRPCPAWERRASPCERELLPHADKHVFVYVLELCESEAKRPLPRSRFYSPGPGSSDHSCLVAVSIRI
jgi:hypothetical protein